MLCAVAAPGAWADSAPAGVLARPGSLHPDTWRQRVRPPSSCGFEGCTAACPMTCPGQGPVTVQGQSILRPAPQLSASFTAADCMRTVASDVTTKPRLAWQMALY